jgi:hypothetical protein
MHFFNLLFAQFSIGFLDILGEKYIQIDIGGEYIYRNPLRLDFERVYVL